MRRRVLTTPGFERSARRFAKLHPHAANLFEETLNRLAEDVFDPRLRTHKLKGELKGCWSARGGHDLRFVFEIVVVDGVETILLRSVGTHDEVY